MISILLIPFIAECRLRYEGDPQLKKYAYNRLDLIAQYLPEDPVIFEAGGHYGTDTIRFAQKWPKASIFSFEPYPPSFEIFLETTKKYLNIQGYPLALNEFNGTAILHVCFGTHGRNPSPSNVGASSLLEASPYMAIHYVGPEIEVPCVVLDDWCEQMSIKKIHFMWLDLEGLELQILKSSPKILETVQVIYTETNFQKFRKGTTQYETLKQFLEESGFQLIAHWYQYGHQGDAIFIRKN